MYLQYQFINSISKLGSNYCILIVGNTYYLLWWKFQVIKSEDGIDDDLDERSSGPKVEFDNAACKTDDVFKGDDAEKKKDEVWLLVGLI